MFTRKRSFIITLWMLNPLMLKSFKVPDLIKFGSDLINSWWHDINRAMCGVTTGHTLSPLSPHNLNVCVTNCYFKQPVLTTTISTTIYLLATQQPAFSRNSKVQQSLLCPGTAFTADYPKVSLALTAACSTVEVRCIDTECCSCIRELF